MEALVTPTCPTPMATETPVLISGAGPTGLFAGILLAKMNIPCRIIEREFEISPLSKAVGIHARTQEILDMTDPSLLQELMDQGFMMPSFHIYYNGKLAGEIEALPIKESHFKKALCLIQNKTVKILADAFEKASGTKVDRGWELIDTKVVEGSSADGDSWVETMMRRAVVGTNKRAGEANQIFGTLELAEEDEEKRYEYEVVKSKYLIGADGGRSAVRHKINMPFPGRTRNVSMILFDGILDTTLDLEKMNVINGNGHRSVAVLPLGEKDRVRIVFDNGFLEPEEFELQKSKPITIEEFQKMLDDVVRPLQLKITKVNWLTYYRINERRAREYSYKGRIFLAGDAAHIHSPAGGQGMNTGLQDAYNLVWKMAMVINGTAPSTLLDSYSEERTAIGDEIIQLSSDTLESVWAGNLIQRCVKRVAVALAPILLPLAANRAPKMSMLGLRYYENSLNKSHKTQKASASDVGAIGCRARDGPLVPFLGRIDSGHNSDSEFSHVSNGPTDTSGKEGENRSNNSESNDGSNHDRQHSRTANSMTSDDTVRLHELMAHPGVFQILVFTGSLWKHRPAAASELVQSLECYLAEWRSRWPSSSGVPVEHNENKDSLRPQFMVHVLTTVSGSQAATAAQFLAARRNVVGEGKVHTDVGKMLHKRYGIDAAAKNEGKGAIVVVRPDSHIAYRVQGVGQSAWEDVHGYFESILI
ncbi:phenol 2-monooxygenase (NADPH) [Entomortierella parvispora]|uniref:Phenol 2-monooxygenase (NADPH) n=1 Tax=Entomortierella parvispora TaxID=205924 RepID=A0A9P3H3A4_9FUNG|nr:phenol 2-monooxygenase (NADPH) [Entomortierella parvispora]